MKVKKFKIGEIFEVSTGSVISKNKLINGTVPRISVKSNDNGVIGYYDESLNDELTLSEHFISVSFMGNVYWYDELSSVEMKVHILKNKNISMDSGLFIVSELKKLFSGRYDYGNQLSSGMLKNDDYYILLPVTKENKPDYETINKLGVIFKKLAVQDLRKDLDLKLDKYKQNLIEV